MKSIRLTRIFAFIIDCTIILIYAGSLFGIVTFFQNNAEPNIALLSPIKGQLISFLTLTVPAFLYFVLLENSALYATTGKRILGLKVVNTNDEKASVKQLLIRNLLKLGPWEIAHFGVHWIIYYSNQNIEPPFWVMIALVVPQIIVIIYFVSLIYSKDARTLYERASGTKVIRDGNINYSAPLLTEL